VIDAETEGESAESGDEGVAVDEMSGHCGEVSVRCDSQGAVSQVN